jgi:Cu(I)/Ag(I) efflux system membrane protein CusA/SilA
MIERLIRWSANNPAILLIAAALATGAGVYALSQVPLLSDTQVIVYTEYSGQAPQVVEDQITYPLSTAMLSARVLLLRGFLCLRDF